MSKSNRLLEKLKSKKMCFIVSLPYNSYELAKIAWEAGADAIKVHINFYHHASGNTFGSLDDNREVFEKILRDSPIPVGIVPGDNTFENEGRIDELKEMGFDFISLFGHHTPATLGYRKDLSNFFSVDDSFSYDEIKLVANSDFLDMIELSICSKSTYGERLNARDLARYEYIASVSKVPTIVPTQHVVYPSDIPLLAKCGISALMVGAISIGKDELTIAKILPEFVSEIRKINEA